MNKKNYTLNILEKESFILICTTIVTLIPQVERVYVVVVVLNYDSRYDAKCYEN